MEESLKFNSQVCTSVEQSKRLLELGLKPETADMCWFNDMQKPVCTPYKCFVDKAQDMKWVFTQAWSLHRLIELYKDVEDTSMWSLENVNYNRLIQCISLAIKHDAFNKQYLAMSKISIIINEIRFDSVNEEYHCSCKGCEFEKSYTTAGCLSGLCKMRKIIFKKSAKSFER